MMENPCKIVCFGDSITAGYYPTFNRRMRREYGDLQIDIINAGVVSDTSVDGLQRLDQVIDLKPNVVIVGFGMNDWRKGVDENSFKNNIEGIVDKLGRHNRRTILATINPGYENKEDRVSRRLIKYNEIIKDVAYGRRLRVADVYSLWLTKLPAIKDGLYDEIHPNRLGNEIIVEALMRTVPRSQAVIVWAFNGEYAFCNYKCEYCYVSSDINVGHYFQGNIEDWHNAFKNTFGNEKLVFYLSFGEPMAAKGFYSVLDMIASEPNWSGHITSNLSLPLKRLLETKLVKEGRLNINRSFHPTQTSIDQFLDKLLFLREHGIECPVVFVMYPPFIKEFESYFEVFDKYHFLVHIRRFRGYYNGKFYPREYTEDERQFIARYCDDATIKYMLNDFENDKGLKGKLTYAGMYYLFVDNLGEVWTSPDCKDKRLGNIFKNNVRLFTEPQPYGLNWNGSVNGVASFLELNYRELEGNFVMSFARQGGVYPTEDGIHYKNLTTDFNDPEVRQEYGFPVTCEYHKNLQALLKDKLLAEHLKLRVYLERRVYPRVAKKRASFLRVIEKITRPKS